MTSRFRQTEQPSVTIILPVGSDALNITSCLESLVQQRYYNLELIVVDNGLNTGTLEEISKILQNTEFQSFIWNQERLRRGTFWGGSTEVHGELVFLASPYVLYEKDCIRNLVLRLQEDRRIKAVIPERRSGIIAQSLTQKFLATIDSSITNRGDALGGAAINGVLFWREDIEEALYWDIMQEGYLESGVARLQDWWRPVIIVKGAQCQPNQPKSFLSFFQSVYQEARYDRTYLPFRTHTSISAGAIVLFVLVGLVLEVFSGPFKVFRGQIILTFLIPLYIVTLWPRLLNWKNIERKWALIFIPIFRILSGFAFASGALQKHFRLDKILSVIAKEPALTILPTTMILLFLNTRYILVIGIIMQLIYLGFTLSLTLFKGSKLVNQLFYGIMLSTPVSLFMKWVHEDVRLNELVGGVPPLLLDILNPFVICLIAGSWVYLSTLARYLRTKI